MQRLRILALAFCIAGSTVAMPQPAQAADLIVMDATGHTREMQLDFLGSAWFFGGTTWFGAAAWFGFPILHEGFVPPWNDSLIIEGGVFMNYYFVTVFAGADYSYLALSPLAGVRWNVHLMEELTVFATAKIGVRIPIAGETIGLDTRFDGIGSVGAIWHMSDVMYLRAEVGNYGIAQVGVSFPLGAP